MSSRKDTAMFVCPARRMHPKAVCQRFFYQKLFYPLCVLVVLSNLE